MCHPERSVRIQDNLDKNILLLTLKIAMNIQALFFKKILDPHASLRMTHG